MPVDVDVPLVLPEVPPFTVLLLLFEDAFFFASSSAFFLLAASSAAAFLSAAAIFSISASYASIWLWIFFSSVVRLSTFVCFVLFSLFNCSFFLAISLLVLSISAFLDSKSFLSSSISFLVFSISLNISVSHSASCDTK